MIEYTYPIAIIIGLTSLGVIYYYNKLLKRFLSVLQNLLDLQEEGYENLEEYIEILESHLIHLGVRSISYEITYMNTKIIHIVEEVPTHIYLKKEIHSNKIEGYICIEVSSHKGERKIINKLVLYEITLQIVNMIYADIEKINESFARIAKMQTFMIHDFKNILQFLQIMQYNVQNLQTIESKEKFIDYLQNSTGTVTKKLDNIVSLLQVESKMKTEQTLEILNVLDYIQIYVQQYNLQCNIMGNEMVLATKEALAVIFDNIFSNIAYKKKTNKELVCSVVMKKSKDKVTLIIEDNGVVFKNPKEVLQPFYTTKADGIGIGMYQVYSSITMLNGTIECKNIMDKPRIYLTFQKP